MLKDYRKEIVKYGRHIFETGLTSKYSGNISIKDPETGLIAIKPSGVPWMDVTESDVVVIDLEGEVVEGVRKPSIETPMHIAVYKSVPQASAVVHTHSTYGTGFAVARQSIPSICVNSVELGGEIPVLPYYPPGSADSGKVIAEGFRNKQALLLAAHGVLCYGADLEEAVYINEVLEEIARLALIRNVLGSKAKLSEEKYDLIAAL